MASLRVELGERSYPIEVGVGLLGDAACYRPFVRGQRAVIVTNTVVGPIYLAQVKQALHTCGLEVLEIVLPDGEAHKTDASLNQIYDAMLRARCDRSVTVIALGGGVIGDLAGFAAATYQRGVPFIQVPTTLLSQVDSSVGGKTGINHPLGKNMIGAFYQPQAVISDVAALNSLPERELRAGIAEVIKHGCIADAEFFAWLETHMPQLLARDPAALTHAVVRSCEIKAAVVGSDERESGLRAILNFGHTFGHAIEAGLGYGQWVHGEAVAAGMVMGAELSARAGLISSQDVERVRALVKAAGLPFEGPSGLSEARYLELMAIDKKASGGRIRFVVLERIGAANVRGDFADQTVCESIRACARI